MIQRMLDARKNFGAIKMLFIAPILIMTLILIFIFMNGKNIEENEDILRNYTGVRRTVSISKEDFRRAVIKVKEVKEQKKSTLAMDAPLDKNISFHPSTPESVKQLNLTVYQITERYWNPKVVTDIKAEWIDPIAIMAQSSIELGGNTNQSILYAPVIPNKCYHQSITPEKIKTFGIDDLYSLEAYWTKSDYNTSGKYQGPLQMSYDYGITEALIKEDLKINEKTKIASVASGTMPYYLLNKGIETTGQYQAAGDRWNWADAVNRWGGVVRTYYTQQYLKPNKTLTGDAAIDNKYRFMLLCAYGHGAGPSITYVSGDNGTANAPWFAFNNALQMRRFLYYMGSPEVVKYIHDISLSKLDEARKSNGEIPLWCDANYARDEVLKLVSEGKIPSEVFTEDALNRASTKQEKTAYAFQFIYTYEMMNALYHGK